MQKNPFLYSFNEKRYHAFNYYLRNRYQRKVAKIILDAGFTCPNRDGTKGFGGCIFCSEKGSGDSNRYSCEDLLKQYAENRKIMERKWPDALYMPYFQAFSNTYGPLDKIRNMLEPFLEMEEVAEIAIATRCDCLSEEVLAYLDAQCARKQIWLELGLQTSSDEVGKKINRQYDFADFQDALLRLEKTQIKTCVHVMNGLPFETREDMLKTIRDISHLPFEGIKIHMLHILKDTVLGHMHEQSPFRLISREQYIELVVRQLEELSPEVVIQRLTGDPIAQDLLAPKWLLNKTTILNDIDKLMRKENVCQGDRYE